MLTRRDYIEIARIIRAAVDEFPITSGPVEQVAEQIADYCLLDNPKFDYDRFLKECGVKK
jgi:hypothetical protein